MIFAYIGLVFLAGIFTLISCWIAAAVCAVLALVLAYRFEVRWIADHTRLTKHKPRPVPSHKG